LKSLSNEQIERAKEPNQLGRPKVTSSENYQNIYNRTRDSFALIKQVSEILPELESHSERFGYANNTVELFDAENFDPILSVMFPIGKVEGAPTSDKIYFEESSINVQKAIFASRLLKFSGDYLLQAFPEQEYPNLHFRINELVNDLKGMIESFNRNQELQKQVKRLEDHVKYFEPIPLGKHDRHYDVACLSCRSVAMGTTIKEAIKKIEHTTKCIAPKEIVENEPSSWEKWYKIQPPKQLLITWDERKLLDKLKEKSKKKLDIPGCL